MTSLTQWTWVWASSGSWWWTGGSGMLQSMGSRRVGHDWATGLNWLKTRNPHQWRSITVLLLAALFKRPRKHKRTSNKHNLELEGKLETGESNSLLYFIWRKGGALGWNDMPKMPKVMQKKFSSRTGHETQCVPHCYPCCIAWYGEDVHQSHSGKGGREGLKGGNGVEIRGFFYMYFRCLQPTRRGFLTCLPHNFSLLLTPLSNASEVATHRSGSHREWSWAEAPQKERRGQRPRFGNFEHRFSREFKCSSKSVQLPKTLAQLWRRPESG